MGRWGKAKSRCCGLTRMQTTHSEYFEARRRECSFEDINNFKSDLIRFWFPKGKQMKTIFTTIVQLLAREDHNFNCTDRNETEPQGEEGECWSDPSPGTHAPACLLCATLCNHNIYVSMYFNAINAQTSTVHTHAHNSSNLDRVGWYLVVHCAPEDWKDAKTVATRNPPHYKLESVFNTLLFQNGCNTGITECGRVVGVNVRSV